MPSTQITMDLTHYIYSDVWYEELFLILSLFCELDALSLFLLILIYLHSWVLTKCFLDNAIVCHNWFNIKEKQNCDIGFWWKVL